MTDSAQSLDIETAEIVIPVLDLHADLAFFTGTLKFRLDIIYPADDPMVAVISGYGTRLRLDRNVKGGPSVMRLGVRDAASMRNQLGELRAPCGLTIELDEIDPPMVQPETQHSFVVRRLADKAPWVIGRAGMQYRDLIPDRLGGSIIASHIRIPDGGPVPDMVHYHTVGFQLIYCYRGWVRLVYEDQGPEFILGAGDCVIQPPEIRHRVLEASDMLEVIEIGVPAEHVTTIDHEMTLPNDVYNPERDFSGQKFCHHKVANAQWEPWRLDGFEARRTGIAQATQGVANVEIARPTASLISSPSSQHNTDILFTFVLEGKMTLKGEDQEAKELTAGDAFVIPPNVTTHYTNCTSDLELLEVSLPGQFETRTL